MAASMLRSPPHYSSFSEDSPVPAKRFALGVTAEPSQPRRSTSMTSVTDAVTRAQESDEGSERHHLYHLALRIYSAARKGKVPDGVRFPDVATKHEVYQLVFDVIHHGPVIEELLIESGFYSKNFDLHGQESLVLIMTYDYQNRKFKLKLPKDGAENVPHLVLKVGEAVLKHRVKLSATLARMRVKSNAQSTTQLLPEACYLKYQEIVTQPFYTRVNRKKVHKIQTDVVSPLQEDGLTVCSSMEMLMCNKRAFCHLQRNLVAFSSDLRGKILQHELLAKGYLVPQDCTSYFLIEDLRDLLSQCDGDVIVTHCNAGTEVAHIASLVRDGTKIIAYGALPMQMEALTTYLHRQDISNVQFVHAPFTHADPQSEELGNVSVVVCLPPSSLSTVVQPLDILHQEGDHLLPLLLSSEREALTRTLPQEQAHILAHALTFSQSQHIVYAVRSREDRETTAVVSASLKRHQATLKAGEEEEGRPKQREFVLNSGAPATSTDDGKDRYHVTLLERKPEEPGPSPAEVIARAVASGVLSGEGISQQKQIKTKRKKKAPRIFSQHKGIPMTISAQKKVVSKKLLPQDLNTRRPFR